MDNHKIKTLGKIIVFKFLHGYYLLKKAIGRKEKYPKEIKTILLVETALMGDVIVATPLIQTIASQFPDAEITVVLQDKFKALLADNPHISRLETIDQINFRTLLRTILRFRKRNFDLVVSVSPGVRNSLLCLGIGRALICGYLVNYSSNTYYYQDHMVDAIGVQGRWPYDKNEHIVMRAIYAVKPVKRFNIPILPSPQLYLSRQNYEKSIRFLKNENYIKENRVNIVIHPGASKPFRQWPVQRFASMIDTLYKVHNTQVNITLMGVSSESRIIKRICDHVSKGMPNRLIDMPLTVIMALIRNCDLFIGNDSGPKFIADAFKRPLVELLGPLLPETVGALSDESVTFFSKVGCNPCPQVTCENDGLCVKSANVDDVTGAVLHLIQKKSAAGVT